MGQKKPKLYSLILSGGKSTRMGADKGMLEYYGKPHREYLFELVQEHCDKVFYSVRQNQVNEFDENAPIVVDKDIYRGPFNGILSAHEAFPEVAWLVLACDLPLMNTFTITSLVSKREPNKIATSYATKKSGLPEPLISIWEPYALARAKKYLMDAESSCPRKFLINSNIALVFPETDEVLYNANSSDEFEHAKSMLNS